MKKQNIWIIGIIVIILAIGGVVLSVNKNTTNSSAQEIENIANISSKRLGKSNLLTPHNNTYTTQYNKIVFPGDSNGFIEQQSLSGNTQISISLPTTGNTTDNSLKGLGATNGLGASNQTTIPKIAKNGSAVYNINSSYAVVVSSSNEDYGETIHIKNQSAATEYKYKLGLSSSQKATLNSDGSITIENTKTNDYDGFIAAPVAKDANGKSVETYFKVDGNTLTQVIKHTSKSYTYPISADPWFLSGVFNAIKNVAKKVGKTVKQYVGKVVKIVRKKVSSKKFKKCTAKNIKDSVIIAGFTALVGLSGGATVVATATAGVSGLVVSLTYGELKCISG